MNTGRRTLSQAISGELLERIQVGELGVGDRLPTEKELMEQFGVGRNVAREAVQVLVALGLVDVRPGRGAVVVAVDAPRAIDAPTIAALLADETVDDLYEFRGVVEVAIAERAARNASDADLRDLRRKHVRFEAAMQRDSGLVEADVAFHAAIARASHNAVYLRAIDMLQEMLVQARALTVGTEWARRRALADHERITTAITARDPAAAAAAMRAHMQLSVAAIADARERRVPAGARAVRR